MFDCFNAKEINGNAYENVNWKIDGVVNLFSKCNNWLVNICIGNLWE